MCGFRGCLPSLLTSGCLTCTLTYYYYYCADGCDSTCCYYSYLYNYKSCVTIAAIADIAAIAAGLCSDSHMFVTGVKGAAIAC